MKSILTTIKKPKTGSLAYITMKHMKKETIAGFNRNIFFAGLVSLFMDISNEMVYPLVPLFLTGALGASRTTVGVIEGIAEATASVLKIFSGWLSDKLGKRKLIMVIGYGTSAVSRPVLAGASTWADVLIARFIDRTGKGLRTAPRDAIIADSTSTEKLGLSFGFHRSMDTVGAIIGPAVALAILYFLADGLRIVFLVSAVPAIAAVLLIIFFIKEKTHIRKPAELPKLSLSSFNGPFKRFIIVITIFSLGNFSDAFLILRAESLGVAKTHITVIYLALNIIYAITSTPAGALSDRIGIKKMLAVGFIFYSLIFAAFGLASSSWHMWALFPVYGLYKGMSDGRQKAYVAKLAPATAKATAFGIYHTAAGLTLLPASVIAGFLWDRFGPMETFLFASALSIIAIVVFTAALKKNNKALRHERMDE
jgi:MFS family permease